MLQKDTAKSTGTRDGEACGGRHKPQKETEARVGCPVAVGLQGAQQQAGRVLKSVQRGLGSGRERETLREV